MTVLLLFFRTSARKPRKNKTDCEEAAHPALSAPSLEEDCADSSTLGVSSKRRLYNAKCPDILLPSTKKVEIRDLQ